MLGRQMNAGSTYPGETWEKAETPDALGWSAAGLDRAHAYAASIGSSAVLVVQNGIVASEWGDVAGVTGIASIRKSLLSALYGIHAAEGTVDLSSTLEELGIDDLAPSLTWQERQATVADLLTSRSGIYHAAADQDPSVLPPRGAHPPGTRWFYNNWDFNILGVILAQQSGTPIAQDFARRIAEPLQMQDYDPAHLYFKSIPQSRHPAYKLRMSARDLARIGLLFLQEGQWGTEQIIPGEWVRLSTAAHTDFGNGRGYGYSWWVGTAPLPASAGNTPSSPRGLPFYCASGWGNQCLMVFPTIATLIVHRVRDTNNGPDDKALGRLVAMLLESRPDA